MKTLLKNGCILNVFTETVEKADVLICNDKIIGIGSYSDNEAEKILDVSEKIIKSPPQANIIVMMCQAM